MPTAKVITFEDGQPAHLFCSDECRSEAITSGDYDGRRVTMEESHIPLPENTYCQFCYRDIAHALNKPCGNPRCGCSSGYGEEITYGSGELSQGGYWEKPCRPCAVLGDEQNKASREKLIDDYMEGWKCDRIAATKAVKQQHYWLFVPCWPETETSQGGD